MKWRFQNLVGAALLVMGIGGLTSCKKHPKANNADLGEAGYKITTEDWFRTSRESNIAALKKFVAGKFPLETRDAMKLLLM
jgi:hypothetical protein